MSRQTASGNADYRLRDVIYHAAHVARETIKAAAVLREAVDDHIVELEGKLRQDRDSRPVELRTGALLSAGRRGRASLN